MGPTYVPRRVLNKMIYETSGRDESDQPEWYDILELYDTYCIFNEEPLNHVCMNYK